MTNELAKEILDNIIISSKVDDLLQSIYKSLIEDLKKNKGCFGILYKKIGTPK